ncbi:MAG: tetratricopeptide repeat protein, partial [Bdellovibrionota bacterium]
ALEMYFEALSSLNEEHQELFEIYKNMGNIYVKMRDFEGAEEYYNKAHTICSASDVLFVNYGTLEFQKADYEKSRMCFRRAVELNPENDRAWAGLAMVHCQYGDQELAMGNILKSVELNPRNRTAHILASEWLMNSKQWSTCIELLQNYLHSNEHDEDLSLRLIHCFCELKKFDLAQIELTRCLVWNPQNQHLWKVMELLGNQ